MYRVFINRIEYNYYSITGADVHKVKHLIACCSDWHKHRKVPGSKKLGAYVTHVGTVQRLIWKLESNGVAVIFNENEVAPVKNTEFKPVQQTLF
jgi:hypothetical protein